MKTVLAVVVSLLAASLPAGDIVHVSPDDVGPDSIVYWQGEYVGDVEGEKGKEPLAAQVAARRNDNYELVLYRGGLPGQGWNPESGTQRLNAALTDGRLAFRGDDGLVYTVKDGTIELSREDAGTLGTLKRTFRTSPTLGLGAPDGAVVLFDGTNVEKFREGVRMTDDGLLDQGARTADEYADIFLHVEYMLPFWDDAGRANSGIYIQDRYEVQIHDSFGHPGGRSEDGALYRHRAPDLNVTLPPYHWQTFDIFFRAPRFNEEGEKTENARISVVHNGVLVHDNVELQKGTGLGGGKREVPREHLYLQRHRGPSFFRNVWLIEDPDGWPDVVKQRVFE